MKEFYLGSYLVWACVVETRKSTSKEVDRMEDSSKNKSRVKT